MRGQPKIDGRTERSRRTRARIVEAATRLFVEQGYLATTIEAVAEGAEVAVQTVYYLFGTKRNLLSAVLDANIVGDLEPVPVLERPWVDELRSETDATAAVERLVEEAVAVVARTAPIYEVIHRAAADPDVGALLDDNRARRRASQRELVELLQRAGHVDSEVDLDTAADVFYGILSEDTFQLLVKDCGWDVERFRHWATSLMVRQLTPISR
jgi:AcrR family transcriptional regulator